MKTLMTMTIATLSLTAVGAASAQSGGMMNGGWMGGYGGVWMPILLIAVVGLVAWIVMQGRK